MRLCSGYPLITNLFYYCFLSLYCDAPVFLSCCQYATLPSQLPTVSLLISLGTSMENWDTSVWTWQKPKDLAVVWTRLKTPPKDVDMDIFSSFANKCLKPPSSSWNNKLVLLMILLAMILHVCGSNTANTLPVPIFFRWIWEAFILKLSKRCLETIMWCQSRLCSLRLVLASLISSNSRMMSGGMGRVHTTLVSWVTCERTHVVESCGNYSSSFFLDAGGKKMKLWR